MFIRNLFPTPFMEADGGQAGGGNNEVGNHQDQQGQGSNNADQQGKDASQNNNQNDKFIPKSRFDEVNNKMKELQEQLDKFNKQKEQEELEAKKKKGEFENLYNETHKELENTKNQFKTTSERVTQLEGLIQTLVDAELEAVPEDMRDLVPENFTPEQKLSWITNAKKKGLFGATQNKKEEQELGGATNNQQQQQVDFGKMSITQLFRNAYGSK
jgi:chromosome segregation ATPase